MTLVELLDQANKAYPDEFLSAYYNPDGALNPEGNGDTLALFVVTELRETYDPDATDAQQLAEAVRVLERGSRDLNSVVSHLLLAPFREAK